MLPDANDAHVLAVAISAGADAILTFNAADFPRHLLAEEHLDRRDPDGFLWELWSHHPAKVSAVVEAVRQSVSSPVTFTSPRIGFTLPPSSI